MTNSDTTYTTATAQQLDDIELAEAMKSAEEWLIDIRDKTNAGNLPPNSLSLQWAEEEYAALVAEDMRRKDAMR